MSADEARRRPARRSKNELRLAISQISRRRHFGMRQRVAAALHSVNLCSIFHGEDMLAAIRAPII